jgi:leader peptidase (prepilin peptidase)/N-methyltransferase
LLLLIFLLGLAVGSFINVLESRLYKSENFLTLPSHCDFCRKKLRWFDMVPVCSWIWYGGRSRCCQRRLSIQYPIVELIAGVAFVVIYLQENIASLLHCFIAKQANFVCFGTDSVRSLQKIFSNGTIEQLNNVVPFIFYAVIFILCFTIFLQDIKYQAIHEKLLWVLIGITLLFIFVGEGLTTLPMGRVSDPPLRFINIFVSFLSALPFYLLYKLSHEKWLGEGDVWLAAWMGLFLGFPKVFWAMYCGLIFGGFVSLLVVLLKLKKMRDTISLGPFLLIGTLISVFIK